MEYKDMSLSVLVELHGTGDCPSSLDNLCASQDRTLRGEGGADLDPGPPRKSMHEDSPFIRSRRCSTAA